MDVEVKIRELLLPILGYDSIEEIQPDHSLINDLGADSLDFVELVFLIEKHFDVSMETKEIISGGKEYSEEEIFEEGYLTEKGVKVLKENFPNNSERLKVNMDKIDIFQLIL